MNKPGFAAYEKFIKRYEDANRAAGKKQYLVNYFIVGHPGTNFEDAVELAAYLRKNHIYPEQIQDYIPLPMTLSACMYYTRKDPITSKDVYVASAPGQRMMQRAVLQYKNPKYRIPSESLKKGHVRK